jgi:aminoglycoside 3-N-acetyltransferase
MASAFKLRRLVKHARRLVTRRWVTRAGIVSGLRALGLREGDLLMVHPSLSALGHVVGGAGTVLDALREVIGERGTLVLPAHSWEWADQGGRAFDVRTQPACVGAIAETFRSLPRVVRSLHPTHSVAALGPLAQQLVEGHDRCRYPCGPGSPYVRVFDLGGRILLLGLGPEYNTSYHAVEALAEVPYLLNESPDPFILIDAQGRRGEALIFRHRKGARRRPETLDEMLRDRPFVRRGMVGPAPAMLIDGAAFRDALRAALRDDPEFLLCQSSPWKSGAAASPSTTSHLTAANLAWPPFESPQES